MMLLRRWALVLPLIACRCMTFDVREDHFFLPGPATAPAPIEAPGAIVESIEIPLTDGAALGGVHVHRPDADVTVVYFGGNASHVDDYGGWLANVLMPLRVDLVTFDYRGYGRSAGTPTIAVLKDDALAGFDRAVALSGGNPVVVHGVSLGGFSRSVCRRKSTTGRIGAGEHRAGRSAMGQEPDSGVREAVRPAAHRAGVARGEQCDGAEELREPAADHDRLERQGHATAIRIRASRIGTVCTEARGHCARRGSRNGNDVRRRSRRIRRISRTGPQ